MRDIARLAGGVHQSTVSLALRNDPAISPATRLRVQGVAKAAGYHRDPLLDAFNARRVSSGQRRTYPVIAFVSDFGSRRELERSVVHAALWRGAARAAESLYHRLELFLIGSASADPSESRGPNAPGLPAARLDSVLYARRIDGVITAAFQPATSPLRLTWSRYCGVKIESLDWESPRFTIAADLLQGTRLAVRQARLLGYRRIGLLLEANERAKNDLIRAGYLIEHAPGPGSSQSLIVKDGLSAAQIRRSIVTKEMDAILSANPNCFGALEAAGLQPGRDIGLACLALAKADGVSAGLVVDYERAGALAIEQVVSLSRINQRGPSTSGMVTYIPALWRDGPSLPRCSSIHASVFAHTSRV